MKNLLNRIKENLTSSKLDLSIFISCVIVVILSSVLLFILISRDSQLNNEVVVYSTSGETQPSSTEAIQETLQETTLEETTPVETTSTPFSDVPESEGGYYSEHGALQVLGTDICDSHGTPVQLKGVSTHGLSWFPEYVNKEAFSSLKEKGVNTIRLAMYTAEYNGYCSGGDQTALKNVIHKGVQEATDLDMYVIIDWHILSDGNPNTYLSEAINFFDEMSKTYASNGNVLYEICNEPNGGTAWEDGSDYDIKSYAEKVISVIRANDPDAIVIVGTPTWSQDIDIVSRDPLDSTIYHNIVYSLHFYAATHKEDIRNKLIEAHNNGLPVFVSEFSICDASGNGWNDTDSANTWMELLNSYNISYVAWNLSNKAESSSLLNSDCSKTGSFTDDDFSESGTWYLEQLK
ncbi:MAG: glycoside hydrolase family 5 protein [Lachnospiraceae bacterium]|nr:glycoside hydrolase family 5 protein [Lachnospiraceae bacterium]